MDISVTRAPRNDTDFVTFALQLGSGPMYQPYVRYMGDMGPGRHPLNLTFGPLTITPQDTVSFTYLVVNSGYGGSGEGNIQQATNAIADIVGAIINIYYPGLGTVIDYAAKGLAGILLEDCDGVVVADKIANQGFYPPPGGHVIIPLTGADLWYSTAEFGTHREIREYPGTDSSIGCGSNSLYYVSWNFTRQ
jgi:hypothetical protein